MPIKLLAALLLTISPSLALAADALTVKEDENQIELSTDKLEAKIRKQGYVTGTAAGSLLDKATGFRDPGFGLDIVDWIMEDGSDESYRDKLTKEMVYQFGNSYHGKTAKRCLEGPQICTQAKQLDPKVVRGADFTAIKTEFTYRDAAPGKKAGSKWTQTIVFPQGKRYFVSTDRIHSVNDGDQTFFRLDMPGHIKHNKGDTFSEIYLSYHGRIKSSEFEKDFAPDEKFNFRRDKNEQPKRFIRAYRLRDPQTGKEGPWLAGMTLDPSSVHEAWCHQRGYVCLIEEIGGRPIKAGQSFGAAFIVGYFDSIDEMHEVYDKHAGHNDLEVTTAGWKLVK